MPYKPNYTMYSKPPQGWHDEPFEYVFSFQDTLVAAVANPQLVNFLNNPLQFDPDADFYMRGIAMLIDAPPAAYSAKGNITFNVRLRDSYGRPLDSRFIPMQAYATNPGVSGPYPSVAGSPVATPNYPELFCPANSAMWADFQAQGVVSAGAYKFYSFHLYFQGIKRFQNEDCKPGSVSTSSAGVAA